MSRKNMLEERYRRGILVGAITSSLIWLVVWLITNY